MSASSGSNSAQQVAARPVTEWHRSGHEAFEHCPRRRFWLYEYANGAGVPRGLMRKAVSVPLLSGVIVHKGLEFIVQGYGEDAAVETAMQQYDETVKERGFDLEQMERDSTYMVQRAICEALIRGWNRYKWAQVQRDFEVLECEQEQSLTFSNPYGDDYPDLRLLTRADLLLKRKSDGRIFIRNFKTINEASERKRAAFAYDSQTISEVLAVEANSGMTVDGVIYDLLVKGKRSTQWPEKSGVWHNNSPLVWAYRKAGQTGISEDELMARYEWECTEPHSMARKHCPGGQKHNIGKEYRRQLVTEFMEFGVEEWLNWLEVNEPQLVRDQFITLEPVMRTPFDVEQWKRAVLFEEARVAASAAIARQHANGSAEQLVVLDNFFPKHTASGNCFWPTQCPAFALCWGTAAEDPLESGYMIREPHHPEQTAMEDESE